MTTSDRIAAAIKDIIADDRREDRERIAQLERTIAHYASPDTQKSIADLSQQIVELTEKCAALVVENKRLREDDEPERTFSITAMERAMIDLGEDYDPKTQVKQATR